MTKKDGGPAFPNPGRTFTSPPNDLFDEYVKGLQGMSLRAWLARQALAGWMSVLANPDTDLMDFHFRPETIAENVVLLADAVIAELEK